jgi:hypothetical protein
MKTLQACTEQENITVLKTLRPIAYKTCESSAWLDVVTTCYCIVKLSLHSLPDRNASIVKS